MLFISRTFMKTLTNDYRYPSPLIPMIRPELLLLIGIMFIACVLRLYQLGTESLWIDEMLSIRDALSIGGVVEATSGLTSDVRPLYYIVLRFWMLFGQSDVWLRGLSVLFGMGAIYLIYELGQRLISKQVGLVGATMMAISPLFINHAQEVRMYSLIAFISLLGTLSLSFIFTGGSRFWTFLWVMSRVALLLTNANNVLILLPDLLLIFFVFHNKRKQMLRLCFGYLVICISFLPTFHKLTFGGTSENFMQQVSVYSKPGLLQIVGMLTQFSAYYPLSYLLHKNSISVGSDELSDVSLIAKISSSFSAVGIILVGLTTLVLLALLLIALLRAFLSYLSEKQHFMTDFSSNKFFWLSAWAILPSILTLAVSYVKEPIWFPRYLLFVAPYFLLMLATGFFAVLKRRRSIGIGIVIVYLLANFLSLSDYYTTLYRNDWQGLTALIGENEHEGDKIVYYSIEGLYNESLPRYYKGGNSISLVTLPRNTETLSNKTEVIQNSVNSKSVDSRLWLVCWVFCNDEEGIDEIFSTLLGSEYDKLIQREFTSVEEGVRLKVYLAESH